MSREKNKLVMLSLFHVTVPNGSLESFLDNTDSLWKTFDVYGKKHKLTTIQMFTVGEGVKLKRPARPDYVGTGGQAALTKGSTTFHFLPKNPLRVFIWLWRELRNVVIIHLNNESWSDIVAGLLGKLRGAKVLVFFHNDQDPLVSKIPSMLLSCFRRNVVDAFLTNALETKKGLSRVVDLPIYLFKFGYDANRFRVRRKAKRDALHVLFVGRLSPEKKVEDIVEAIASAKSKKKIVFHIVGDDTTPQKSYLTALLNQLEKHKIQFKRWGFVPHSRIARCYQTADVFVNMRPDEAFGKVFVEAMATGLPVIGRKGSPGAELLIRDGVNGFKVESPEDLASVLDRLARRRSVLRTLGRQARAFVEAEYSEDQSFASLARAYDDLRIGQLAEDLFYHTRPLKTLRRIKRLLLNQRVDRCDHAMRNGVIMHKEQHALYDYCQGKGIDIGCGNNKTHPHALGVDLTPGGTLGTFGNQKGQRSAADIQASGDDLHMFRDGELDYVVARHNLEHYQDPIKALREWKRVVRRGGTIGIVIPDDTFRDTIHLDPTHYHVFTPESFRAIIELIGGLNIVKLETCVQDWSFVCVMQKV